MSPLHFSQINIDGLSQHSKTALDKFAHNNSISLLALQETKLKEDQINSLENFPNHESYFLPKVDGTYGVGFLISPDHLPQRIPELEEPGCDIIWCLVKVNNTCLLTASAYTPPNNLQKLQKLISNINNAHQYAEKNKIKDMLVFGDFNSRHIIWGDTISNKLGRSLLEFIDSSTFMLCTPADRTFVSPNNGGSVIDLLLGYGKITGLISENWTDKKVELFTGAPIRGHFPVLYLLGGCSQPIGVKEYDDYNNTDWDKWRDSLDCSISSWYNTLNQDDKLKSLEFLVNGLNKSIKKAKELIPKKIVSKHSKPFWTNALTVCSHELKDINISVRTRFTPRNNQLLREKKEEFKKLLTKEKNDWIREKLSHLNHADSKEFWKRYRRLFNAQKASYIGNLQKNGIMHTSEKEKEKILFEEFFSGSHLEGHEFDLNFHSSINKCYNAIIKSNMNPQSETISFVQDALKNCGIKNVLQDTVIDTSADDELNQEISMAEVEDAISNQKADGKTTDGYDVNPIMLKHLGPLAKELLFNICNLSLETGSWQWRYQDVCFLKKQGKPSYMEPGAYRPICISSYIGKIIEKILEKRLRKHCEFHGILDDPQEGFCPKRSTTRYLFKLLANLEEVKKKRLISLVLLIDFQKAFDSVWIPGLITKLYNYGVTGQFLSLINSFLCNRHVRIKINGNFGEFQRICALIGLPQGSVLSPLLFILYIAEMLQNFHNCLHNSSCSSEIISKAYKFADDGTVTVSGNKINDCYIVLQSICDKLFDWCKNWRLIINCDQNKTEVIIIHGQKSILTSNIPKVKIGDNYLHYVKKSRVLGIILDDQLSFLHHAKDILKRCWHQWYRISKDTTRHNGLNTASLTILFKTLVIPKLMYASPTWLHKQLDTFKDLWSRVLLKIIGSEYHTERKITEVTLSIPPLNVQLEVNSVKFLLKCLSSDDEMIAILLNIEQQSNHPLFSKIFQIKKYICWKQKSRRQTARTVDLISSLNQSLTYYSPVGMRCYQNKLWWNEVKTMLPHLDIDTWVESNGKLLFPPGSIRSQNSLTAEYIHGHSIAFMRFRKAVKLSNTDICDLCDLNMVDSKEHRLFECLAFDCDHRQELLSLLENNIADFEWKVVICNSVNMENNYKITQEFLKLVKYISTEINILKQRNYLNL